VFTTELSTLKRDIHATSCPGVPCYPCAFGLPEPGQSMTVNMVSVPWGLSSSIHLFSSPLVSFLGILSLTIPPDTARNVGRHAEPHFHHHGPDVRDLRPLDGDDLDPRRQPMAYLLRLCDRTAGTYCWKRRWFWWRFRWWLRWRLRWWLRWWLRSA
jgi:hypothetical protein